MMLITKCARAPLPFVVQFLLRPKSPSSSSPPLLVPLEFPLSGTKVIIYVSKNPSTFFSSAGRVISSVVVVFPLKLFIRPEAAQFSWVLFISRDKGGEERRERKKGPK